MSLGLPSWLRVSGAAQSPPAPAAAGLSSQDLSGSRRSEGISNRDDFRRSRKTLTIPAATNVEPVIGPSPAWETNMQRQGRQEMAVRLREEGPAAAADY